MANIIVTAPNGTRCRVRVQQLEEHVNQIPEVRNSVGELLAPPRTETFKSWADKRIDVFASEARAFEVSAGMRIVVEDDPSLA